MESAEVESNGLMVNEKTYRVCHLYVAPDSRRKGVGSRKLQQHLDAARERGTSVFQVSIGTTEKNSRDDLTVQFLENFGLEICFVEDGEVFAELDLGR